jgi:type II secretory pathway component PulC
MASVRRLKKEIEYLSSQMIGDSIDFINSFEGKEQEIMQIIDDTVNLHNEIIDRINTPDGKDNRKIVKAYYKQVKKDYISGLNVGYKKLETLFIGNK